jgi:hypothetical protein
VERTVLRDVAFQVFPIDKFHRVEVGVSLFPEMVNSSDMGMMDQSGGLSFAQEALLGSWATQ